MTRNRHEFITADRSTLGDQLDLFIGASSDAVTQVYARMAVSDNASRLAGRLVGPFCCDARTLSAALPFRDLGPGPSFLARCTVPDVAPWSPDHPHLYRAELEVVREGHVAARLERMWGVRRFGAAGRDFRWNSERVVLRGVSGSPDPEQLLAWKEARAALVVDAPDEPLCEAASQLGVAIIAFLHDTGDRLASELRRLARWPAVIVAVLSRWPEALPLSQLVPNLVCAAWQDGERPLPAGAQAVVSADLDWLREQSPRLPLIAMRSARYGDVAQGRGLCDELQADLAPAGPFAGYLIS